MSLGPKPAEYQQQIPPDLQSLRNSILPLLQSFTQGNGQGGANVDNFFGQMGSPATALQRQSTGGISQYLNQPAPEQQAFDLANPALKNILGSAPGQGVIDALRPTFDKNLAQANQQGGRFGSSNAILKSNALNDFNLLGAQAAQHGQDTQLQAAQMLGMLGGQAGQNPFSRLLGAYGVGSQDAGQQDLYTQRHLQLLQGLLGMASGAAFNVPTVQSKPYDQGYGKSIFDALLQAGVTAAGAYAGK